MSEADVDRRAAVVLRLDPADVTEVETFTRRQVFEAMEREAAHQREVQAAVEAENAALRAKLAAVYDALGALAQNPKDMTAEDLRIIIVNKDDQVRRALEERDEMQRKFEEADTSADEAMEERDVCEGVIDQVKAILGIETEWSNWYEFEDFIDDAADFVAGAEYEQEELRVLVDELRQQLDESKAELAELSALVNHPHTNDFLEAVRIEAVHQTMKYGVAHDAGKAAEDWFWLLGYLAGKAVHAAKDGNTNKALHHTISSAAALLNWHAHISGVRTAMRSGIDPPYLGATDAKEPSP